MPIDKNVAYLGSYYPHHAYSDLKEIADCGFTSITLCINELDWWRYRDVARNTVRVAQDLSLKVFIDMHGFGQFAGPHSYFLAEHPECCQVDNIGNRSWNRGCPNNPYYVSWIKNIEKEIINHLEPDGMFWDEPHFASNPKWPEIWSCRCECCQEEYRKRFQDNMPKTLTSKVFEFREMVAFRFLESLMDAAKATDQRIHNQLCLMPNLTGIHGFRSWKPVKVLKNLRTFATDPYWAWSGEKFEWFVDWSQKCIEFAHRNGMFAQIWVALIKVPKGREREILFPTILKAAELGADSIATWSYRGGPGSIFACEDPETSWRVLVEAYKQI
ncbi:MAG: hypothetical protein ACUVTL_07785 [Thermoproteota archaeon]